MKKDKNLTNEALAKNFVNTFQLVTYAIGMAKQLVARDEEREYNPATRVLDMILHNQKIVDLNLPEEREIGSK